MMNRKNMTASTLDETALDTYYTLTEVWHSLPF